MCTRYCHGPASLSIASVILQHVMTVWGLGEADDETDLALNLVLSCLHTLACIFTTHTSYAHCIIRLFYVLFCLEPIALILSAIIVIILFIALSFLFVSIMFIFV